MAIPVVRLLDTNLAQLAATLILGSSQDTAFPLSKLKDQSLGAVYRSLVGWTIVAGFNDKIDFNRGGVKVATIAPGWYPTAAALCAAIVTAMEAADATPAWACSYSPTTFKFTINTSAETFTLLFLTGASVATSIHLDLGYTSTDKAAAASQVAENTSFQSRHFILFDLGSAMAVTAAVVRYHNAGAGGTFTLYGKSANNPWVSPGAGPTVLAGDSEIRLAFFGSSSLRYWAIVIADVQNPLGFAEVGIAAPYTYRQPSVPNSVNFQEVRGALSTVAYALGGANYTTRRQRRRSWSLEWLEVTDADRLILEAWEVAAPVGINFFLAFDAVDAPANTVYAFILEPGLTKNYVPGGYWTFTVAIVESVP